MGLLVRLLLLCALTTQVAVAQTFDFAPVDGPWRPLSTSYHDGAGLVVGTADGTVYRSLNGGRTWAGTDQPLSFAGLTPYKGAYLAPGSDGLYRSTDRGASWSVSALEGTELRTVVVGDSVYVVDAEGVISRSSGDLASWTPLALGWTTSFLNRIAAGPGGHLAVVVGQPDLCCASELHVSTDAGATFTTVQVGVSVRGVRYHDGALYLLLDRDASQTPFVDAGVFAWNAATATLDRLTNADLVGRFRLQPGGVLTYVADGELMAVGETAPQIPDVPGRLTDVLLSPETTLVTAQEGTAWSDGGRYVHVGVRNAAEAWGVGRLPGGDFAVGTGYQGVFRWDGRWSLTGATLGNAFRFEPLWDQPDSLLVLQAPTTYSARSHAVLTADGTVPLAEAAPELAAACGDDRLQTVTFVGDRAVGTCEVSLEVARRFVLDRGGQAVLEAETVPSVAALWAAPDGTVYAGRAPDILEPPDDPIQVSTDGGLSWASLSDGAHGSWIFEFAEHDGAVWAAATGHIFRLDGSAWTPTHSPGAIRLAQHDGDLYAAGSSVLRLVDGVWTDVATGLDDRSVLGLVVGSDDQGPWAVAGTYGNPETATAGGVMSTRPGLFVGADAPPASADRRLRISPNPARGLVRVETGTNATSYAEVVVFDVLGREVARLVAVQGVASWDATRVAPGVYTVRVVDGDVGRSGRVVVVR